jgi:DNA-binding MarR family transcriptional regulator
LSSEKLTEQVFETFDSINAEMLFEKLKFSLKGENMPLAILNNLGGECSISKITKNFDFTAARLSAVIKSLEAKGFVKRIQNEKDRRTTTVVLTTEGAMHYLKYRQEAMQNALVIIEQLGEEDICEFLRIIKKLSDITNNSEDLIDTH